MSRAPLGTLALIVALACDATPPSNALRAELNRVRQAGPGATIDLAHAVRVPWDTVVILNPYSSRAESDAVLGYAWRSTKLSALSSGDSHNLLVFLRAGRVAYAELMERAAGDFCCFERNRRYSRGEASFVAMRDGTRLRLRSTRVPNG